MTKQPVCSCDMYPQACAHRALPWTARDLCQRKQYDWIHNLCSPGETTDSGPWQSAAGTERCHISIEMSNQSPIHWLSHQESVFPSSLGLSYFECLASSVIFSIMESKTLCLATFTSSKSLGNYYCTKFILNCYIYACS